jgi:hypothetical protein
MKEKLKSLAMFGNVWQCLAMFNQIVFFKNAKASL